MTLPHAENIIPIEEDDSSSNSNSNDYDDLPTVSLDEAQDVMVVEEVVEEDQTMIPTVQAEDYSDPDFDDAIEALITNGEALKKAQMILPPPPPTTTTQGEEGNYHSYVDDISSSEWEEEEEKCLGSHKLNQRNHYAKVRAEYISASFIRSNKQDESSYSLGLKIHPTTLIITHIELNSVAASSPLRVGDKLISINHYSCKEMTSIEELRNALQAPGMVTLVVHNQDKTNRAPDVVESMLTKLDVDAKIGIAIKKSSNSYGSVGALEISSLNPHLGAMHSLFNPTDELLSINGVNVQRFSTVQDAVQLISNSKQTVTMRVKTRQDTGVVLGEEEKLMTRTTRSINNTFGIVLSKPPTTTTSSSSSQAQGQQRTAANTRSTSPLPRWFQSWQSQPQQQQQQQPSTTTNRASILIGTAAA